MTTIVTRSGKGSPLTNNEVDSNFLNLNNDKVETTRNIGTGTGLTGGGDLSADRSISIANTGVTAAVYGSASEVPVLTINEQGQITLASTATIATTLDAVTTNGNTTTNGITIGSLTATDANFTGTGAIQLPSGTTAQQPVASAGMLRYNAELDTFEGYTVAGGWGEVAGGLSESTSTNVLLGNVLNAGDVYQELTTDDLKTNLNIHQTFVQPTEPTNWTFGDIWVKTL